MAKRCCIATCLLNVNYCLIAMKSAFGPYKTIFVYFFPKSRDSKGSLVSFGFCSCKIRENVVHFICFFAAVEKILSILFDFCSCRTKENVGNLFFAAVEQEKML